MSKSTAEPPPEIETLTEKAAEPPPEIETLTEKAAEPPPEIENWTKENIHQWLMTVVKVDKTYADMFVEEEVSGENVDDFEKKDILELGIKHGPAVKITSYLERMKDGSKHESQFPEYVETWTKEQVNQWLLQHLKMDVKKAEKLLEEDVSGDCLVCFKKQDLLDLQLKSGPAVKILKELDRLKNKPNPLLNPPQTRLKSRLRLSFIRKRHEKESQKTDLPPENTKETTTDPAPIIKNTLDKLRTKDLKSFSFELSHYTDSEYKPIPLAKLEDKDTVDTASLLTEHYSSEALKVTRDILHKINQRKLVSQLETHMGQVKPYHKCCADEKHTEDTVKSDSPSSSRASQKKKEEPNVSCFMDVKLNAPSCFK